MRISWLLIAALALPAAAEPMILTGPFGVPLKVQDEFGNWSIPIRVYSDKNVEIFAPDVTSLGWKSWHAGEYRKDGKYAVQMLVFYKGPAYCLSALPVDQRSSPDYQEACGEMRYKSELLVVDTRHASVETVTTLVMGEDASFHPELQNSPKSKMGIAELDRPKRVAIAATNSLVCAELSNFTGSR